MLFTHVSPNQQTLPTPSQVPAGILSSLPLAQSGLGRPPRLEITSCPGVRFWRKKDWTGHLKARKGETNGNGTSVPRRGRPRDESDSDSDSNCGSDSGCEATTKKTSHPYLENADGTAVKRVKLRQMSQKARRVMGALRDYGRLPQQWSDAKQEAYGYYCTTMLSDPDFSFLRFCDDGEWKLQEWTTRLFPSWARKLHAEKGEERKIPRRRRKKLKTDILEDPKLLTIELEEDKIVVASPPQAVSTLD